MPLAHNNPLLQDAPQLEEDLGKWLRDDLYCKKALEDVGRIQGAQPYDASLFSDLVDFPAYSLVAYAQQEISLSQFTSIILQWSASQDFPLEYETVKYYQLPEKNACEEFRRFLNLSGQVFFNNNKISDVEFDEILKRLCDENVPDSERIFSVLYFKDLSNMATIFCTLKGIGFELFMPIIDEEKGDAFHIVPSFTIIQTVCNVLAQDSVQLEPRIGETPTPYVGVMHALNRHPFGISFPGYTHEKADGHDARRMGFAIHDVYHTIILSFLPIKKAFMELTTVAADYVAENNIACDKGANFALDFLIDAEYSQFFHQRHLHKQYDQLDDESIFINGLLRLLFPEELKLFSKELMENTPLSLPTEKQLDLFDHLIEHILKNSEGWADKYNINIPNVVSIILGGNDVIRPTIEFFSALQQEIDRVLNDTLQDDLAISFLLKQRKNIDELKKIISSCFEIMRSIIRTKKITYESTFEIQRFTPITSIHQNMALIREAQFANMTCFYNALYGMLEMISTGAIKSELLRATKGAVSLFSKISPDMAPLFAQIELLLSVQENHGSINDAINCADKNFLSSGVDPKETTI